MQLKLLVQLNFGVGQYPNTKMRYTTLIGDGNSKAYSAVVDSKPYGDVEISKSDCVGRYCTSETKEDLGQKEATEWENNWWSRLSYKLMDKLQGYYGKAIREK